MVIIQARWMINSNRVAMSPHQTWIIANTLSDLLIASAMFYHVNSIRLLYMGSLKLIPFCPIPQLRRIWARDGKLSSHALVSIVRLIVETNLATSKDLRVFDVMTPHPRSATISIASMLMVVVYPMSGSICHVYSLPQD